MKIAKMLSRRVLFETLALRCRMLAESQIQRLLSLSASRVRQILAALEKDGAIESHQVWTAWAIPSIMGPLYTSESTGDFDPDAVAKAARAGIERWRGRPARSVRIWMATEKTAKMYGGSCRPSRQVEAAHDLLWAEAVIGMKETAVKEELLGRQFAVARSLRADAIVTDGVTHWITEVIGLSYTVGDILAFAEACREKTCAFRLY